MKIDFSFHLQYFQKDLPELVEKDPEHLFNLAFSMKINTKQMKKWEKEYAAVRKKEQEEMTELRVSNRKKQEKKKIKLKHKLKYLLFPIFSVFETKIAC